MSDFGVDAVIFDLGGVLADFGGVGPMRALAGIDTDEELWHRWLTCRWVRNFERGDCTPEDFAVGVVADWSLPISPTDFLDTFRSWVAAPFPGAGELVQTVKRAVPVGCLSNTNVSHWADCAAHWPLVDLFDFRFLSFELGLLKPDREVFEHVVGTTGVSASRLLFLDDNLVNVESARAVGLEAVQVRGVAEARRAVMEMGLLETPDTPASAGGSGPP